MFYLLKYLLLLNLVIFKLKCNNLIFNKIMVLNALYACLLHSRFVENLPIWILEDDPSFLRWFYHTYHEFDASYVLMRNKFGKIVALYVGRQHKWSKTYVWVTKCLVANLKGRKQI
jgi:hypothetical protein